MPLPESALISTPCSAAMRRTRGDDFVRRRSSSELPPFVGGGGVWAPVEADWWDTGGVDDADSLRGGPPAAVPAPAPAATGADVAAGDGALGAAIGAFTSVSNRATTVWTAT